MRGRVRVECIVPNVHTSHGKLLDGQRAWVAPREARALVAAGAVREVETVRVPTRKPARWTLDIMRGRQ